MIRFLYQLRSPAGTKGRLSILIFHRVAPKVDPLFPAEMHAVQFDAICTWLRSWAHVLPLAEAVERLRDGRLPSRALSISFDDGYADNHDVAVPILRSHGLSATFFVTTGFLEGGRMWNDSVIEAVRASTQSQLALDKWLGEDFTPLPNRNLADKQMAIAHLIGRLKYLPADQRSAKVDALAAGVGAALPSRLMMSPAQVQAIRQAGMHIGAHTVSHPILARSTPDVVEQEMRASKHVLESLLDERIGLFAYPNGKPGEDYNGDSVAMARKVGFDAAFSTRWAAASAATDRFELPRFTPWDNTRFRFGLRLIRNLSQSPT